MLHQSVQDTSPRQEAHRGGSRQQAGKGPAETFTGDVWVDEIAIADEPSRLRVYKVRFAPGARTAWHSHALGPTLHVIDGVGRVQSRGGEVIEIRTGDTIYTPPGEWPWHGATPDRFMAHFAIAEAPALGDGGADPVSADDDPGAGLKRLAVTGPADDAGDVAVAVSFDVSYGDAELHVDAGGGGCVHDDRVEHGAPGRVQGVHAVRRLDGDRYDGVGVAERRPVYRGVPAVMISSSRPHRDSWSTPPRISACVERVSLP
jgi:quercetin dioxygenase-like cupin family protein